MTNIKKLNLPPIHGININEVAMQDFFILRDMLDINQHGCSYSKTEQIEPRQPNPIRIYR
jgi:hypothetical protein